ncbi:MAG: 50S ribosomal protein P1 [Candidatus Hydrothermarchaeota archaeon]|jgi:large subunit ribosomal protein L12|nr:50S ribosomal protein P1 [Candidatus Hydrothermarchaeota archaeon]
MEYVYAAMLLHAAGKDINKTNLTKVLKGPGIKVDEARMKALIAALDGVDIDEAIKQASVAPVAQAHAAASAEAPAEAPAEDKKKEEKKEESEEEAMAGLGALFG